MGRPNRVDVGGHFYHVLNRSVGRRKLFRRNSDYEAFEGVLAEAVQRSAGGVKLLAYCVMPNHWHLVLRTTRDGALSPFMKWLTLTHTQRYRVAHRNVGEGPVYQGRFKSCLVEGGKHLLTVCRYVERNAARAELVERAEDWPWSSLWHWRHKREAADRDAEGVQLVISPWPAMRRPTVADGSGRPKQWLRMVNAALTEKELTALRTAAQRGRPFGSDRWVTRMAAKFNLQSTIRSEGRPRKNA